MVMITDPSRVLPSEIFDLTLSFLPDCSKASRVNKLWNTKVSKEILLYTMEAIKFDFQFIKELGNFYSFSPEFRDLMDRIQESINSEKILKDNNSCFIWNKTKNIYKEDKKELENKNGLFDKLFLLIQPTLEYHKNDLFLLQYPSGFKNKFRKFSSPHLQSLKKVIHLSQENMENQLSSLKPCEGSSGFSTLNELCLSKSLCQDPLKLESILSLLPNLPIKHLVLGNDSLKEEDKAKDSESIFGKLLETLKQMKSLSFIKTKNFQLDDQDAHYLAEFITYLKNTNRRFTFQLERESVLTNDGLKKIAEALTEHSTTTIKFNFYYESSEKIKEGLKALKNIRDPTSIYLLKDNALIFENTN